MVPHPQVPHILMVDDDTADIDLTREALLEADLVHTFAAVRSGEECLARLRRRGPFASSQRPDLILLDINMPGMGGLATLAAIREDPALADIPVVVLTTSDDDRDVEAAYGHAANAFVTKPVGLDDFSRTVQAIERFWLGDGRPALTPRR